MKFKVLKESYLEPFLKHLLVLGEEKVLSQQLVGLGVSFLLKSLGISGSNSSALGHFFLAHRLGYEVCVFLGSGAHFFLAA